ncbi:MAG: hypothetical protein EP330_04955 [Deltaproteobacteria bacterium]|nr:MAG: hypothetical protein EP330_04955 [Deltaproteobacteria bacterium]
MLILLTLIALADPSPREVRIELTASHPYCGGAAPSPEQERAARTPTPVPGHLWLLRAGAENTDAAPIHEVRTDASGHATLSLAPGTYCLVGEDKRSTEVTANAVPSVNEAEELACRRALKRSCDRVLEVPPGREPMVVAVHEAGRCFYNPGPCYFGPPIPPPPSAAPGPRDVAEPLAPR